MVEEAGSGGGVRDKGQFSLGIQPGCRRFCPALVSPSPANAVRC